MKVWGGGGGGSDISKLYMGQACGNLLINELISLLANSTGEGPKPWKPFLNHLSHGCLVKYRMRFIKYYSHLYPMQQSSCMCKFACCF